jgi:two-component system, response regulator PdtaR
MTRGKESVASEEPKPAAPPVVLIVEDDFWTRFSAAQYLRNAGYQVIEAKDANEAISVLGSKHDIQVVFSDVNLPTPSMNGLALSAWISQRHPSLPVILTSGDSPNSLPSTCKSFFIKPYSLADVEREIRGLV